MPGVGAMFTGPRVAGAEDREQGLGETASPRRNLDLEGVERAGGRLAAASEWRGPNLAKCELLK